MANQIPTVTRAKAVAKVDLALKMLNRAMVDEGLTMEEFDRLNTLFTQLDLVVADIREAQ